MNANQNMSTFFSPESIACCNFTKWQWSGIEQMILHTVYHFHYFSGPLNCPMFYLKGSNTFTLIHTNSVYFLPSCLRTEPLLSHLTSFDAIFHLVPRMSFAVRQCPGLAVVFLWSSVRGYQHNTRLNMLEHIPSNPEHTVIRGDWASYQCDAQTHAMSLLNYAKVCGCGRGEELGGSGGHRVWRI